MKITKNMSDRHDFFNKNAEVGGSMISLGTMKTTMYLEQDLYVG